MCAVCTVQLCMFARFRASCMYIHAVRTICSERVSESPGSAQVPPKFFFFGCVLGFLRFCASSLRSGFFAAAAPKAPKQTLLLLLLLLLFSLPLALRTGIRAYLYCVRYYVQYSKVQGFCFPAMFAFFQQNISHFKAQFGTLVPILWHPELRTLGPWIHELQPERPNAVRRYSSALMSDVNVRTFSFFLFID
jgi:hypothetical protein